MAAPARKPPTKVEIHVACENLKSLDLTSKSDPIAVCYMWDQGSKDYVEVGRTEWVKNARDVAFAKAIVCDYFFEESQEMQFRIHDVDDKNATLSKSDLIGVFNATLGSVVGAPGNQVKGEIQKTGTVTGNIKVTAEPVADSGQTLRVTFSAKKLDNKDFFGKSDPFLVISRLREAGDYIPTFKTDVVMDNLNPTWKTNTIPLAQLAAGDVQVPLRIECFDWDNDGSHDLIGVCEASVSEWMEPRAKAEGFPLINPEKKRKKKSYSNSGTLFIDVHELFRQYTFLDYVLGGSEIGLLTAIDFTGSNGVPSNPKSLHHIHPNGPMNQYETAISAVGSILAAYDSDKMFPVWGFGGKIGGTTSHCFPLNGNPSNPEVPGIEGIQQVYRSALAQVALSGPTFFTEIIRNAANICRAQPPVPPKYFILLIITDGVINDMMKTIAEIVGASSLPLSIVIVGVGDADFAAMDFLDADKGPLQSHGKAAVRDIVQFVPFRKYGVNNYAMLAKEVLAEIPDQFISYVRAMKIPPPQSPSTSTSTRP
eukprot:TRINITY_DN33001_c0_g1_i1.p1 TRINITY_DN33001_c0_g1~~TRINITY_DN33001_c0_g1_i1.p1  ORF type:complete len:545 (+),score=112.55 TRINITY_DN33001_c0_g1_i1:24-1637(+)